MTIVVAIVLMCLGACAPEHSPYSEFRTLDTDGWHATMPLRFAPTLDTAVTSLCCVEVAVRHNNSFPYCNLNLVVDFIDSTYKVTRHNVAVPISNEQGSWTGNGFGRLYQDKVVVAGAVDPSSLRSIVVWQAMKGCDKVTDIENVGIIISLVNK